MQKKSQDDGLHKIGRIHLQVSSSGRHSDIGGRIQIPQPNPDKPEWKLEGMRHQIKNARVSG